MNITLFFKNTTTREKLKLIMVLAWFYSPFVLERRLYELVTIVSWAAYNHIVILNEFREFLALNDSLRKLR